LTWALPILLAGALPASAAQLPDGFAETRLAAGLNNVTAMSVAPDGRVFVSEQGTGAPGAQTGNIKIVKTDGTVVTALTLTVDATNERGVLGTAFDPAFPATPHIYLYYTVPNPTPDPNFPNKGAHNRVSRFTVTGDTIDPSSEVQILNLPDLGTAPIHNAGSLHFAPDGTLFISVGENFNAPNSQNTAVPLGKLLRINKDGTIPADNPFVGNPAYHPAIWALGLRNPFTFDIQPGTGRILENDVGDKLYDEINDIVKGGNYGWADTEGPHNDPRYLQPFVPLPWSSANCTVIGAAFYNPANPTFPQQYLGKYFHSDLCAGFINVLDPATGEITNFVPRGGLKSPVDLDVSANGDLYYLNRGSGLGTGEVWKIFVSNGGAHISAPPVSQTVTIGETAAFTCSATGFKPVTYTWTRNGGFEKQEIDPPGGTSTLSFPVTAGDNGASIQCQVSNSLGTDQAAAALTATTNVTPNATILTPPAGATYRGGDVLNFSGDAFDQEDGPLPASAFTWEVLFDHETHSHPGITLTGVQSGTYTIPSVGETSANVKYRIILRVKDSTGLVRTVERNVLPVVSNLTIGSAPAGREVKLDGQPKTAPLTMAAVAGMTRTLDVQTWQHLSEGGPTSTASTTWFQFQGWSDGGAPAHSITVPDQDSTVTANFNTLVNPECITFPTLSRFLNMPFANQTGQFNMEFDAIPVAATASKINVTIGFSDGPRGGLPGQAGAILFAAPAPPNPPAVIQGRGFTGGEPAAASAPPYLVNQLYHFRLNIDLGTHTYDAYYTAPGQPEAVLKLGLRFRAEHLFITQLNNWGVFASPIAGDPTATVKVCRMSLNCTGPKNTPPVITVPPNIIVKTGAGATSCDKVVTDAELGNATVTDNCAFGLSGITRSGVPAGNLFPKGTTTISYTASDGAGLTTTATQTVTVIDDTPPVLSTVTATPNVLWPPDHRLVTVTINYTTSDNCGPVNTVLSVKSDQPEGIFKPDWIIVDAHHVKLRAERSILAALFKKGRTYTVTVDAIDASGNVTSKSVLVKVPAWLHTCSGSKCCNPEHKWDKVGD
jgi:glucose/arabinose dehydrogenase